MATLVAEDDPAIDYRRASPNGGAHQTLPNELALVGRQAVHVSVVRTDVDTIPGYNWASPKPILLFGFLIQTASGFVLPDQFAARLLIAAYDPIFRGRVDMTIDDRRRRVRVGSDA